MCYKMVEIRIHMNQKQNRKVGKVRIDHNLISKEEAIKHIIDCHRLK